MFNLRIFINLILALALANAHTTSFGNIQIKNVEDNSIDMTPFVRLGANYYFIEGIEKENWFEASHICRRKGAHLAAIESADELKAISDHLVSSGYQRSDWFWLSGTDNHHEGHFVWASTGNPMNFTDWSPNQPDNASGNENCVHLWMRALESFQMNDWICGQKAHYICETEAPKSITFTVL